MQPPRPKAPVFVLLFFSMFGFVGLTILGALWSRAAGESGVPVFVRMIGSLIALMFVIMGFGVPLNALKAGRQPLESGEAPGTPMDPPGGDTPGPTAGYRCPNCGAQLGPDQEVSPSGDAKCGYCKRWWNIHRGSA